MQFKKLSRRLSLSAVLCIYFLSALVSEIAAQTGSVKFVHDPCIIKSEEYYYIYSTGDRIDIRRSPDLLNWEFIGSVFDSIPAWGKEEVPGVRNIWAPDIVYYNSTYYLFYSLSTFGSNRSSIGLAANTTLDPEDPDYKWIDKGKVIQSATNDNFNAIDPNVVMDKDNRIWLSFGSFWDGIRLVELDSSTWKPKQNYKLYSIASRSGEAIEAPFIIYKNGYYYLFVSFDFCCKGVNSTYNIRVGRSEEITGPYIDSNGIAMLRGGGNLLLSGDERWKGPGHCAVFQKENVDWLIFHTYDAENNGVPTLRILPLEWDSNGWVMINTPLSTRDLNTIPDDYFLYPNYPNPFNPTTTIRYTIPKSSFVTIKVFNLLGQEIAELVNEEQSAGNYNIEFSAKGRSAAGGNAANLASGIYMYRLSVGSFGQAGDFSLTKKMILLQ